MGMKDQEGLEVPGRHLYLQQSPGSTQDREGLQGSFPPPHGAISVHKSRHCKSENVPHKAREGRVYVCVCV